MIEINTIGVWGFKGAISGMRFPYESNGKSDSCFDGEEYSSPSYYDNIKFPFVYTSFCIGKSDLALCKKLIKGGSEHRKFLRMIHVQAEVRAPRYWWAEMDKYKWVEANSSSTMHLITKRHLTEDDFGTVNNGVKDPILYSIIPTINDWINDYHDTSDNERKNDILRSIKQLLPESFMQKRMIDTNYECLLNIYHQRKNHRLTEWHEFCDWIRSLPYTEDFINA